MLYWMEIWGDWRLSSTPDDLPPFLRPGHERRKRVRTDRKAWRSERVLAASYQQDGGSRKEERLVVAQEIVDGMVDEPNGRRGGAEEDFSVGMRHNALEFDLADVDEDRMLDFEGECSLILTHAPCSQMCLVLSDHALHAMSSALDVPPKSRVLRLCQDS